MALCCSLLLLSHPLLKLLKRGDVPYHNQEIFITEWNLTTSALPSLFLQWIHCTYVPREVLTISGTFPIRVSQSLM